LPPDLCTGSHPREKFRASVEFTGRRKPISMSGTGKAAWRHTAPAALFFAVPFDGPEIIPDAPDKFGRILAGW
jgi:hypothetical protein